MAVALVWRLAPLVPWGIALVGAAYALFLRLRGGAVDSRSVYVAAALVTAAEAAFVAFRTPVAAGDARTRWDEVTRIVAIVFATLLGGGIVLAASGAAGGGLVLEGLGVAASVVAVAAAVIVGSRTGERSG